METHDSSEEHRQTGDTPSAIGTKDKSGNVILVPLDGSVLAETVLPHAMALARATSSGLRLMRVVPPLALMAPMGGLTEVTPELWDLYEEQPEFAREYLREIVNRLGQFEPRVDVVVTEGDPAESILKYAGEHPEVTGIAMSTHGRSGLGKWLFGSVAERILHGSPVPLLLLRPDTEPEQVNLDPDAVPRYKTLLVPLDGSALAEQALPPALAFAEAVEGRLVLISVTATPFDLKLVKPGAHAPWSAVPWSTPAERLVKYLDAVIEKLSSSDVPLQARVTYGDIADEILKVARFEEADVIVMATHGRSGLGHLLIGSIARRVAQEAAVPVLLVRVTKQQQEKSHAGSTRFGATGT